MATQLKHIAATLLLCLCIFPLVGCILPFPTGGKTHTQHDPGITPIVASFVPARVLQFCADTKPLVPDSLFKSAAALVADMLDSTIPNVNEGAVQVYISYITSSSYLKDAFSFSVPAIGTDQQPSLQPNPDPATYKNPYDLAAAVATVTSENATVAATAQAQWGQNHAKLAAARDLVKQYTNKLRSLPNIDDPTGEDVGSCLQSAQDRMRGFLGKKTIIIASPLAQSASTLPFIDLSGITVEVINKTCVFASTSDCIASSSAWRQKLLSFHASSVSIHDPQQSQVEKPTF